MTVLTCEAIELVHLPLNRPRAEAREGEVRPAPALSPFRPIAARLLCDSRHIRTRTYRYVGPSSRLAWTR
ncbi:hypothetical protein EVAR_97273_1 [Eumeta japonica]|uniref:Uncharacterized protein n=1 Tax=Eumeta variegata TaxID=151549 RepID=A0A4C1XD65_EUMVA|nr:hypothetical protein EVAR_97273_1 [Eumeta japonica]